MISPKRKGGLQVTRKSVLEEFREKERMKTRNFASARKKNLHVRNLSNNGVYRAGPGDLARGKDIKSSSVNNWHRSDRGMKLRTPFVK